MTSRMFLLSKRYQKHRIFTVLVTLIAFLTVFWYDYRLSLEIKETRFPDGTSVDLVVGSRTSSEQFRRLIDEEEEQPTNTRQLLSSSSSSSSSSNVQTTISSPKIAIAIISAFDWEVTDSPYDFREARELHRETWMKHPAIRDGRIRVYFVLGNQPAPKKETKGDKPTQQQQQRNIATDPSLRAEVDYYGDIVLLNCTDVHNNGKMNAWYIWAADNNNLPSSVEYHIKLDDESYVHVDNLLRALQETPRERFLGGIGNLIHHRVYVLATGQTPHSNLPWVRGWGYILSTDLIQGLGKCSEETTRRDEEEDTNNRPPSLNTKKGSDGLVVSVAADTSAAAAVGGGRGALYTSSYRIPWNSGGQDEDVYTSLALRLCGLDHHRGGEEEEGGGGGGLNFNGTMRVGSLREILSFGCYDHAVRDPILIHGGMRDGTAIDDHSHKRDPSSNSNNPFRTVSHQVFYALQNIYHPKPGMEVVPTYLKWERLRQLFLYDLHACDNRPNCPTCNPNWRNTSCIPQSNLALRRASNHRK